MNDTPTFRRVVPRRVADFDAEPTEAPSPPPSPVSFFKERTPEEKLEQQRKLAEILRNRK